MPERLNISVFGSSLVSSYWNGAATYYRGVLRALAARGHRVRLYEPDALDRARGWASGCCTRRTGSPCSTTSTRR